MGRQWMYYTFVLILAFLVLTRWEGLNKLLGTGGNVYLKSVGVLQGRELRGNDIRGIAR